MNGPVETSLGLLQGGRSGEVHVFKGIPYAQPPLGRLRFAPPLPPSPWVGVREAGAFSAAAMQNTSSVDRMLGSKPPEMSEDCLTLNVWTVGLDDARRPVMVWIHGGSFLSGSGRAPWYDGSAFALNGEVVVVTINYRLGALGFLHLAPFDDELASSGNAGLLDQVAALRWVRDNIAGFGGNPDNVTLFGESAGAMGIGALLACAPAQGLFHKAILQSGAADNVIDAHEASRVTRQLLDALGLDAGRGVVERLRGVPCEAILDAQADVRALHLQTGMPWRPVLDGSVINHEPLDAIGRGDSAPVRLLVGTNLDEVRFFTLFDQQTNQLTDDTLIERCDKRLGNGSGAPLVEQYRAARPQLSAPQVWAAIETDRIFRLPAIELLDRHARHQNGSFGYLFTWATPAFGGSLGACHVLEVPFVFDNLHQPGVKGLCGPVTPAMQQLAANLHAAWTAFAHSGDPNHPDIPTWSGWGESRRPSMVFDETCLLECDPGGDARTLLAEVLATNRP